MKIVLIGYRATGKTTLARLLAERLGWQWADADEAIEKRAGKSIARIFAEDGEPAFRDLEAGVIAELCRRDRLILATGGGAPMREPSRRAMRGDAVVIWLIAKPQTILQRICGDETTAQRRPNLTDETPLEEIIQLLRKREAVYRESAHLTVDTEGKTPQQLVAEILGRLPEIPDAGNSA